MVDIVKTVFDVSVGELSEASKIFTRHWEELFEGTVHLCEPSLAVEVTMLVQLLPLLVEYWIFTLPTVPVVLQVIVCDAPTTSVSPPLGEVTVMVGVVEVTMENTALLTSDGVPVEASFTLTLHFVDETVGIFHE